MSPGESGVHLTSFQNEVYPDSLGSLKHLWRVSSIPGVSIGSLEYHKSTLECLKIIWSVSRLSGLSLSSLEYFQACWSVCVLIGVSPSFLKFLKAQWSVYRLSEVNSEFLEFPQSSLGASSFFECLQYRNLLWNVSRLSRVCPKSLKWHNALWSDFGLFEVSPGSLVCLQAFLCASRSFWTSYRGRRS